MINNTINQIHNDTDFMKFIHLNFMKETDNAIFPEKYEMRKLPIEAIQNFENKSDVKNILERQLIRENIYLKYKFDIFENPIVVFYEDEKAKKLKPFKKHDDASKFSQSLLNEGIYSMLILIMNKDIECEIYKD